MKTIFKCNPKLKLSPIFARHETFHPRFGWLKKGFDKAIAHPDIFSSENAPTVLGVGKNMVKAIKYWCIAFKVLEEIKEQHQGRYIASTAFGKDLLSDEGWDPYLEDPASLWLLHWHLLRPPCYATAWYYIFNIFNKNIFEIEDLTAGLIEFKDSLFPNNHIRGSSVIKDIACILRMYTDYNGSNVVNEDSIDSPLIELGLINNYDNSRRYIFNTSHKHNLPSNIIVYACLDYMDIMQESAKTISVSRLTYDTGSPGLSFRLSESTIVDAIERVSKQYSEIVLNDTAGLIQMSFKGEPKALSKILLKDYYGRGNN